MPWDADKKIRDDDIVNESEFDPNDPADKAVKTESDGYFSSSFFPLSASENRDGDLIFDGNNTYSNLSNKSTNTYTLTKHIYAKSIEIQSGVTIKSNGYALFATEKVYGQGKVSHNAPAGQDASGSSAGSGASISRNTIFSPRSGGGGGGNPSYDGNDSPAASGGVSIVGAGKTGGSAGNYSDGSADNGGGGGSGNYNSPIFNINYHKTYTLFNLSVLSDGGSVETLTSSPGGGGGGHSRDFSSDGGAGGGGGASAGIIPVIAKQIDGGITWEATGGDGGDGGDGVHGGGGGAAGNGGAVIILYREDLGSNFSYNLSGGVGGSGGTGSDNEAGAEDGEKGEDGTDGDSYKISFREVI